MELRLELAHFSDRILVHLGLGGDNCVLGRSRDCRQVDEARLTTRSQRTATAAAHFTWSHPPYARQFAAAELRVGRRRTECGEGYSCPGLVAGRVLRHQSTTTGGMSVMQWVASKQVTQFFNLLCSGDGGLPGQAIPRRAEDDAGLRRQPSTKQEVNARAGKRGAMDLVKIGKVHKDGGDYKSRGEQAH